MVLIVVVGVVAAVFLMGSPLVGKWNVKNVEVGGQKTASSGYIEFWSNGTGTMNGTQSFTWKDVGGGNVDLTVSVQGVSVTVRYSYIVNGSSLTLQYTLGGTTYKIYCERA